MVGELRTTLPRGCSLEISIESEPRGTGGAVVNALSLLDERFLLINGDTWFDFNWNALCVDHEEDTASVGIRPVDLADRYETIEVGVNALATRVVPRGEAREPPFYVNGGVYCFSRSHFASQQGRFSLEADLLPSLAAAGKLRAVRSDGYFLDIGVPETYARSQVEVPARRCRPALIVSRITVIGSDCADASGERHGFKWAPGAIEAIRKANEAGYFVFVTIAQADVESVSDTPEDVARMFDWMQSELRKVGAHIDDCRIATGDPDGMADKISVEDSWREQTLGMLQDLTSQPDVDVSRSLMIGEQVGDRAVAHAAGLGGAALSGQTLLSFVYEQLSKRDEQ